MLIAGFRIRAARDALSWSKTKLSIRAGVALAVVRQAEDNPGQASLTLEQANALLQALVRAGASLPSLLGDPDDPEAEP